jgi:Phage integrase SAM-like domain
MTRERGTVWVTKHDRENRKGYRVRFRLDGKEKELYFPGHTKRSKASADNAAKHLANLIEAKKHNVAPPAESVAWANGTKGKVHSALVRFGLADAANPKLATDEGRLLGAFLTSYIDERTDVKKTTRTNYLQTRRLLIEHFGGSKELKSITEADAERFQRWMVQKPLAEASVSKHSDRTKTMFSFAVKDRLLAKSPFANLKGGDEASKSKFFVSLEVSSKVLVACPDAEWRLIFSLARFGGLRCPSELRVLKWTDILWGQSKFRIDSPKTGERFCPLFPEVLKALEESFHQAPEGAVYCIPGLTGETNLRTGLERILRRAGVEQWPRLFVNLRSTRRTELDDKFPSHVVDAWMGHSSKVAEKHYKQVTDNHFEQGAKFGSHAGPHSLNDSVASPTGHKTTEPSEMLGSEVYRWLGLTNQVTPTGIEPVLPP